MASRSKTRAPARRHAVAVEISLRNADALSERQHEGLVREFRRNLEEALGGGEALEAALSAQFSHHSRTGSEEDCHPHGPLGEVFAAAEQKTWSGRRRPPGAHFCVAVEHCT